MPVQPMVLFPDENAALAFVEQARWPNGIVCPFCGCANVSENDSRAILRCGWYRCHRRFSHRTGTLFKDSHHPIHKWLTGMFLFVSHDRTLTSVDLSRYLGVSQTTGYRQLKFFRQACQINPHDLPGTIDVNEIDLNGREKNLHLGRWFNRKRVRYFEQAVMGVFDQDGRIVHFGVSGKEARGSVLEVLVSTLPPGVVADSRTAHVLGHINTQNIPDLARLWRRVFYSVQMEWGHQFVQDHLDEVAFRMHMGLAGRSHLQSMRAMILNSVRVHKPRQTAWMEFEKSLDGFFGFTSG